MEVGVTNFELYDIKKRRICALKFIHVDDAHSLNNLYSKFRRLFRKINIEILSYDEVFVVEYFCWCILYFFTFVHAHFRNVVFGILWSGLGFRTRTLNENVGIKTKKSLKGDGI